MKTKKDILEYISVWGGRRSGNNIHNTDKDAGWYCSVDKPLQEDREILLALSGYWEYLDNDAMLLYSSIIKNKYSKDLDFFRDALNSKYLTDSNYVLLFADQELLKNESLLFAALDLDSQSEFSHKDYLSLFLGGGNYELHHKTKLWCPQANKELIKRVVATYYPLVFGEVIEEFKDDKEFVSEVVKANLKTKKEILEYTGQFRDESAIWYSFLDKKLQEDRDILVALSPYWTELDDDVYELYKSIIKNKYSKDLDFFLDTLNHEAVIDCMFTLIHADEEVLKNESLLFAALDLWQDHLYFIDFNILASFPQEDIEIMKRVIAKYPEAFEYVIDKYKDDKEFVKLAVEHDRNNLAFASDRLIDDKEFMSEYVKADGSLLAFASKRLRADSGFVSQATSNKLSAVSFAAKELIKEPDGEFFDLWWHYGQPDS